MLRLPTIDPPNLTQSSDGSSNPPTWRLPSPVQDVQPATFMQDSNREAAATNGGGKGEGPDSLGKAPANNTLQFLRRQTVLLAPGQHQLDVGVSYSLYNSDFPLPIVATPGGPIVAVDRERIRRCGFLFIPTELQVRRDGPHAGLS